MVKYLRTIKGRKPENPAELRADSRGFAQDLPALQGVPGLNMAQGDLAGMIVTSSPKTMAISQQETDATISKYRTDKAAARRIFERQLSHRFGGAEDPSLQEQWQRRKFNGETLNTLTTAIQQHIGKATAGQFTHLMQDGIVPHAAAEKFAFHADSAQKGVNAVRLMMQDIAEHQGELARMDNQTLLIMANIKEVVAATLDHMEAIGFPVTAVGRKTAREPGPFDHSQRDDSALEKAIVDFSGAAWFVSTSADMCYIDLPRNDGGFPSRQHVDALTEECLSRNLPLTKSFHEGVDLSQRERHASSPLMNFFIKLSAEYNYPANGFLALNDQPAIPEPRIKASWRDRFKHKPESARGGHPNGGQIR